MIKTSTLFLILISAVLVLLPGYASLCDSNEKISHLLNRLTYGPRPGDLEAVKAKGIESFIQEQLHPQSLPEADEVIAFVSESRPLTLSPAQLLKQYGPPAVKAQAASVGENGGAASKEEIQKIRQTLFHAVFQDVAEAKVLRALVSPRQLQEEMTEFWCNHFNVFANKALDHIWIGSYEQVAIRPYALGKFRDLLGATCHHAAMLFYLDNWRNRVGGGKGTSFANGSNENYARELMELHTLGVDGGYKQKDVTELARILTGLGLARPVNLKQLVSMAVEASPKQLQDERFGFYFDRKRHDFGTKIFLGHVIAGSGEAEIEQALDILAKSPATAHHISYKLAQYFVADQPPPSLVNWLAATFTKTDGNIREVLNDLFHSPEFWDKRYQASKFKNPFRYIVSTLRVLDAKPTNYQTIYGFLKLQGMPLYGCLTPDGFKNVESAWLNPDTLLKRINFSTALTLRQMPGIYSGSPDLKKLSDTIGGALSPQTEAVINKSPDSLKAALMLGSPEFMRY